MVPIPNDELKLVIERTGPMVPLLKKDCWVKEFLVNCNRVGESVIGESMEHLSAGRWSVEGASVKHLSVGW